MAERTVKERPEHKPAEPIVEILQVAPDMITVGGRRYQLVLDHKHGFARDKFAERYMDILEKYDYIVGDWGYEQLRLRGFYRNDDRRANKDQQISTLQDYLYEYCNFGCAYFVLERLDAPAVKPRRRSRPPHHRSNRAPYTEKTSRQAKPAGGKAETVAKNKPRKRHFTIRTRATNEE
ncbi:YutD family protein [Lacticaseibacillus jixianensis]|uniref:YutD family protein n=1 Tax=Lacticaseibacillus jixianensis TaxID=2486012 RepID=A0ABW4B903_9LACO|nr:YutD family protein [Lacticaseibacillus jixianensis]